MFIVTQIFDEPDYDKDTKQAKQIVAVLLRITYYAFQLFTLYEAAILIFFELFRIEFAIYFFLIYFFFFKSFYLAITRKSYTNINMIEEQNLCKRCNINREPTTHHCKVCQQCVLEMDHHCFFIGNCVGKNNYCYFISFLFYTFTLCSSVLLYLWPQVNCLVNFKFKELEVNWLRLIFVYMMTFFLLLSVISMIFVQAYVLANNSSFVHLKKQPNQKKYTYCQFILSIFKKQLYKDIYQSWKNRNQNYNLFYA